MDSPRGLVFDHNTLYVMHPPVLEAFHDDNGDGVADPHNLYDAAGAAANYLCFGRAALTDPPSQISALLSYNASLPYTATVLAAGHAYQAALAIPDGAPRRTPTP